MSCQLQSKDDCWNKFDLSTAGCKEICDQHRTNQVQNVLSSQRQRNASDALQFNLLLILGTQASPCDWLIQMRVPTMAQDNDLVQVEICSQWMELKNEVEIPKDLRTFTYLINHSLENLHDLRTLRYVLDSFQAEWQVEAHDGNGDLFRCKSVNLELPLIQMIQLIISTTYNFPDQTWFAPNASRNEATLFLPLLTK